MEIDSCFYRMPIKLMVSNWAKRTTDHFRFTAKLEGGDAGVGLPPAAVRGQRGVHPGNGGTNSKPKVVRVK
jgi:hypothetical protein